MCKLPDPSLTTPPASDLSLILKMTRQGLFQLNPTTQRIKLSAEYATLLGLTFTSMEEDLDTWLTRLHADDRNRIAQHLHDCMTGQTGRIHNSEFRIHTAAGEWLWLRARGQIMEVDDLEQPLCFLAVHSDISSEKKLQAKLDCKNRQRSSSNENSDITPEESSTAPPWNECKQLEKMLQLRNDELSRVNAELAKASRMKDEFLACMSHELRTPLTGVLNLSEALQENVYGPLSDAQRETLAMIETSGRHLLDMINDILDLAKIGSGQLDFDWDECPLDQICHACLHMVRSMANKKNLHVEYNNNHAGLLISTDPRRFKQILLNLLSNAIKFTPDGGNIGINIKANTLQGWFECEVWDTGIGIAEENLSKLFQPFLQVDSRLARQYNGTGLGLTLVNRLTDMHNGSVSVSSILGKGSRFTLHLPLNRPIQINSSHSKTVHECTVLIVDDQELSLRIYREYLNMLGYQVITARNGVEALQKLQLQGNLQPDVVIMDVQMPVMDGITAVRHIRALPDPALAHIPVLAVTALNMTGDKEHCLNAGYNAYLQKPVQLEQLSSFIRRFTQVSDPGTHH